MATQGSGATYLGASFAGPEGQVTRDTVAVDGGLENAIMRRAFDAIKYRRTLPPAAVRTGAPR